MNVKKRKGFTLVELSIVLIVIGLLSGAILKGQEIIKNAKLKRIISDFSNISTAIYTYEDRYDELPGDDATSVIAASYPSGGNEDGVIDAKESSIVFKHLRKAGIISGDANDNTLGHSMGGKIFVVQGSLSGTAGKVAAESMRNMTGVAVCFEGLKAEDAKIIDAQNDDGVFQTGAIQASRDYKKGGLITICAEI